jgi:hypothetical protein
LREIKLTEMGQIADQICAIKESLKPGVTLDAVSKTKPPELVIEAYNAGQRVFGENKVQEMVEKYNVLPKDIEWHLIGHLQTNKVKYIAPFVHLIHSIDSLKLLSVINSEAIRNNRIINCLLQLKIAREETKFGFSITDAEKLLSSQEYKTLKNVRICGLMGMATFTEDLEQVRLEFRQLKIYFDFIRQKYFSDTSYFKEISMGMSDDYPIAVEEGSTMVRVGSKIFGERMYLKV